MMKFSLSFITCLLGVIHLFGQGINFNASGLIGESLNNPTSLEFGPDGKLYVSQQDGTIWQYTIERDLSAPGSGSYTIVNSIFIDLIKNDVPNHNDDGTINSTNARQVTGILTAGTSANPVLYVTSSDSRIGGGGGLGNDVNLDTNSGILSRLTWNGQNWDKVDLVRGLPRCEENHATNGLDSFTISGVKYLLIQQGGNTNMGAPSNNFAGSSEYYLAGAILIVNLTQLEQIEATNGGAFVDSRQGSTKYIYDLPTLNDPDKIDINNTHPEFPYNTGHPLYNATIDLGDPFGGNNGLNQSIPEIGGPVQIFSPGFRNAYDIVITENGMIYTSDNGCNEGWGGSPLIYDSNGSFKGDNTTATFDESAGDYITSEFNITSGQTYGDSFHFVGSINDPNNTYYGGHPVPIRAFPQKSEIIIYEYNGSNWISAGSYNMEDLLTGVSGYYKSSFSITDFPDQTREGEFIPKETSNTKLRILDVVNSSTNGICEYTATNFNGEMTGNILSASFNGKINRYVLNSTGDGLVLENNSFLSGFGAIPLDVIAQGDNDPFPGTIWAATYGADNITIFEPADFGECVDSSSPDFDPLADYDFDGYTNQDEIDNNTDYCSGGSKPLDNDGDFISDLNDDNDDNDTFLDFQDPLPIDEYNGLANSLPIDYPFWNNDPGTGFFGLGFTGLLLDPSGAINYINQYDEANLSFGGAGGKATIDNVSSGDALGTENTQENAFQFGFNVDSNSPPFTIHTKIETPFNGIQPLPGQSYGLYVGTGDQDNYFKVAIMDGVTSGDNINGFEVVLETNSIPINYVFDVPNLLNAGAIDIYLNVNPQSSQVQPYYSLNSGEDIFSLGNPIDIPSSYFDLTDNIGLITGLISSSGVSNTPFIATWDFINIREDGPKELNANPNSVDYGNQAINSGIALNNVSLTNIGSPGEGAITISSINISGPNSDLFNTSISTPLIVGSGAEKLIPVTFTPDDVTGAKSATLEIVHDGVNSPLTVSLTAVLSNTVPLARINAGSATTVTATDGGPNWEATSSNGAYSGSSFTVNTGNNAAGTFLFSNKHTSVPSYIDQNTFAGLFGSERWDPNTAPEMQFSVPLENGDYTVNLFLGNSYNGTDQIGERIFDILIEGALIQDNLDLISSFGHRVAGMLSYPVTVNDGTLNISFGHVVENPLINAIEVIGVPGNQVPVAVASATPLVGEAPQEVTFIGSNSTDDGTIITYAWDFKDGNTSSEADPLHTYTVAGTYDVSLTVTDDLGLTNSTTITIDVSADLPQTITLTPDPLDFGSMAINSNASSLNLDAFNNGGPTEPISITAINITGTDASMFSFTATLPLTVDPQSSQLVPVSFTPDDVIGTKSATLEIVHDGVNSPLTVSLTAVLSNTVPLARINAGSATTVTATDGGPNWEATSSNGAYSGSSFTVNTGNNAAGTFLFSNKHSSVPSYIDQNTFAGLFGSERWDPNTAPEMQFSVPLENGDYTVNLFLGNSYTGTNQIGDRIFDILIEGALIQDNLDLISSFGHQVAGMLSYPVTVNDGTLNISFGHVVENPLINAIEVIGVPLNQVPVAVASATPLVGEVPQEITFIGSNSTDDGTIITYAWDFKDGNTSSEADPIHTYTVAGTYDVSLTVTDELGLTNSTTITIDVSADLPQTITLTPDPLDFGSMAINSNASSLNLDAFNNGGPTEPISITAINITGTDASMFSFTATLPLTVDPQSSQLVPVSFTPDDVIGTKSATLEIVHDGLNSPLSVSLTAVLSDYPILVFDPITDQFNQPAESSNLVASATGGDPNENITYSISGQPLGLDIEPTNGQIIGIVDQSAIGGGPNNNGVHSVLISANKPGSTEVTQSFTWTISAISLYNWNDKLEDESYTARHECSFVQAGDKFYLFGGRENATTMDVYDYTNNQWNALNNSIPKEFNHFQAVEYEGLIWVIGAFVTNSFPNELPADFIWAYNPDTNDWIQGPEIPSNRKRGSTGLVVFNDKFYIVGGNTIGHNGGYVSWFDEYDPLTGTWTILADAPRARDHFHAAVINGKLYAASGRLSGGDGGAFGPVIPEVDVYDFASGTWEFLNLPPNLPTPRAASIVANFENKLLVAGGESLALTTAFTTTEIYDPVSQEWTTGPDLNYPRHGTQGIVSGNTLYVTAGSPVRGGGNQLNMEYYGIDDVPSGSPIVSSTLNTPSEVLFLVGESKDINITISNGDIGIIIKSLELIGADAAEFFIESGDITNSLLKNNSQHLITLTHLGTESNKSAQLVINYDNNSLSIPLTVGSGSSPIALARINTGSATTVTATDGGPNWEATSTSGAYTGSSFTVNTGNNAASSFLYTNRHSSVPSYIDQNTFAGLFGSERWDQNTAPEMQFSVPLANGDYTVNLFLGNSYIGTDQVGERIFDILIEGALVQDNLDLISSFGHRVAGMLSYPVTVNDGTLNISFGHVVENPLINAIEIIGTPVGGVSAKANIGQNASGNPDIISRPELVTNSILISPNPANLETNLNFIDSSIKPTGIIYVFSMDGRLVKKVISDQPLTDSYKISTYSLEEGMYILNIPIRNGSVIIRKLIVRH